ncbi:transcriptional regulator, TetR family [Seinonella peptonophila]|uniref:Transcriptional regulator, TetR family n=1 Tax=Seinonella peptonophila TaxID=112248 RepID=A0A1M4SS78_9BACL|nr:TetR/AcrR family transcriptional regulator [Seinonella peptonophila]SHE35021.1 transcriptional regulator, TetR family [Seinonella peptonophila]
MTSKNEDRSQTLILAAYHTIAEKGFEGLRLREVADRVGLNHATLHHYFPTKEALVQAVVLYVTQRFAQTVPIGETPVEQLRSHLHLIQQLMQEEPALFIALNEAKLRAQRDPIIRITVQKQAEAWHEFLVNILREGIKQGNWSESLDVEAVASAIIALINSTNIGLSSKRTKQAMQQLERWLELND